MLTRREIFKWMLVMPVFALVAVRHHQISITTMDQKDLHMNLRHADALFLTDEAEEWAGKVGINGMRVNGKFASDLVRTLERQ